MGNIDVAIENLSIANSLIIVFPDLSELLSSIASHLAKIYRDSDNVLLSLYWTRISGSKDQQLKWRKRFGVSALLSGSNNSNKPSTNDRETTTEKVDSAKQQQMISMFARAGKVVIIAVTISSLVVGVVIGRRKLLSY